MKLKASINAGNIKHASAGAPNKRGVQRTEASTVKLSVYLGCRLSSQHRDYERGKDGGGLVRAGCKITGCFITERSWRTQNNVAGWQRRKWLCAEPWLLVRGDYRLKWFGLRRELTWPLGSFFGGRVLAFGLHGGRVEDARGRAVLAEMILQAFDGAIQLVGPDLEVDVHEICQEEETAFENKETPSNKSAPSVPLRGKTICWMLNYLANMKLLLEKILNYSLKLVSAVVSD